MKKITFVTGSMGRGGAERVISLLTKRYADLGYDVSILMLLHSNVGYELDARIRVIDLSNDKIRAILDMPRLILAVRKFVKKEKPDAIVTFMAQNCLITGLACRGRKTRIIMSERIDPSAVKRGKFYEKVLFGIYANADVTVLQTERARNYFPEEVQQNSVIIPNPIDVKCIAAEEKRKRIVTAGRLTPQKNQKMLIEAFAAIHKSHPEYILDIYGDGPLQKELQAQIDALRISKYATLKGNASNIHEEISDAEIFVLSSDFEGLSNALLEAMMMGLPCVATNCSGSDEVIRSEENGLLIPVGDEKALEGALEKLIAEPAFALKLGKAAREDSERFAVDCVIEQWREAIEG